MTENVSSKIDRKDEAALVEHARVTLETISKIPPEEIESILGIITKKPETDPVSGEIVYPRTFVCMGTESEISENMMELIHKLVELVQNSGE